MSALRPGVSGEVPQAEILLPRVRSPVPRFARSAPGAAKVDRPPYERLMAELAVSNWSAVAREYGVSDKAVRKWVRWYEADIARREEGAHGHDAGN